jgi:hypothetical protein
MSDHHYETRQLSLWDEYRDLNGRVSFDAFMERHPRVNAYIVNLLKSFPDMTDRAEIDCARAYDRASDDYADAYANPKGGI